MYQWSQVNCIFNKNRKTKPQQRRQIVRYYQPTELKSVDYAAQLQSITAAAGIGPINLTGLIAQGTNFNARIGNKIFPKSLEVRLCVYQASGGSLANVRFVVFQDLGLTSTLPLISEVMASATLPEAMRNFLTSERFRILYDKYMPNIGNQNQHMGLVEASIPLPARAVQYVGSAATQASTGSGAIYYLMMTDNNITAAAGVGGLRAGWDTWMRLSFQDA
jgi:hypothetical protein